MWQDESSHGSLDCRESEMRVAAHRRSLWWQTFEGSGNERRVLVARLIGFENLVADDVVTQVVVGDERADINANLPNLAQRRVLLIHLNLAGDLVGLANDGIWIAKEHFVNNEAGGSCGIVEREDCSMRRGRDGGDGQRMGGFAGRAAKDGLADKHCAASDDERENHSDEYTDAHSAWDAPKKLSHAACSLWMVCRGHDDPFVIAITRIAREDGRDRKSLCAFSHAREKTCGLGSGFSS